MLESRVQAVRRACPGCPQVETRPASAAPTHDASKLYERTNIRGTAATPIPSGDLSSDAVTCRWGESIRYRRPSFVALPTSRGEDWLQLRTSFSLDTRWDSLEE